MKFRSTMMGMALAAFAALAVPAHAASKTGVILMHGKKGSPSHMARLAQALERDGMLVLVPEMPWSAARAYDRPLTEAHTELDAMVATLRQMGAAQVVIGGHSMGANMAIGYAATHDGIAAVMALGPGQTVEAERFRDALGSSVERARALVAEGRGEQPGEWADLHLGQTGTAKATAAAYLSYFDPHGLANMPATMPMLKQPVLWTVGSRDKNMLDRGSGYAFDKAPANPASRYLVVDADHMGTPDASISAVRAWLGAQFR